MEKDPYVTNENVGTEVLNDGQNLYIASRKWRNDIESM